MFYSAYWQYYLMGIILLPGLLFAMYAQWKVTSTYSKYRKVMSQKQVCAGDFIRSLLPTCGLTHLTVKKISGELTDHYDPRSEEICLSEGVYDSQSVASLGIACHELGHALQKKEKYAPYQIRRILVPVTNIASTLLWPLVVIGLIFNIAATDGSLIGNIFLWSGIGFFGLAVLFNLATLPVEFDASRRSLNILESTGTLNEEELDQTREVLRAAALTYVATLVVSILNFLRFLIVILSKRDRR